MNIRKQINYSEMYFALDKAVSVPYNQLEMYTMIGQIVSFREEKGAAVAAAEYLHNRYPDMPGFSPRNLRRMRDFYRTYAQDSSLLNLAKQVGWTQNVVILEADLTIQERRWYLTQVTLYTWSKKQLMDNIQNNLHLVSPIDESEHSCYTVDEPICVEKPNEESIIREPICPSPRMILSVGICISNRSVQLVHKIRSGTAKFRLRQLRPPARDGTCRHPGFVLYLWRRFRRKDLSCIRIFRFPFS